MARKAVVDRDVILSMLKEGRTTQSIAGEFGVSRQAIDLHRRDFISKGLLTDQRAARGRKPVHPAAPLPRSPEIEKGAGDDPVPAPRADTPFPAADSVSLDDQIDLVINAFDALRRLPVIEQELNDYRSKYDKALLEIDRLRSAEQKRLEQERRWLQVRHPER